MGQENHARELGTVAARTTVADKAAPRRLFPIFDLDAVRLGDFGVDSCMVYESSDKRHSG